MVHLVRLAEGERLPNEARKPLPQSVDPTLDVRSLAFLLAGGFVLLVGDHPLVSLPQVAVTGRLLVAFGDRLPQTLTGCPAALARDESHHLAGFPAQSQPDSRLIAFAVNEGPQLVQFEHLFTLLIGHLLGADEGVFQVKPGYFF